MINTQSVADKTAMSLSLLCTIHCLIFPLLAVFLPSMIALPLQDEIFHVWLVIAVVPVSAYALTMGCKNHKRYQILLIGSIGLLISSVVAFFGHDLLGEALEKVFTVIGAMVIAIAHIWNYRLCQQQDQCACPEQNETFPARFFKVSIECFISFMLILNYYFLSSIYKLWRPQRSDMAAV